MFFLLKDQEEVKVAPGLTRKVLATGGKMMTVQAEFKKGIAMPPHSHPHEQISYIISGKFTGYIGGKSIELNPGDTYYVPPNVEHTVTSLEDSVILDVFTPQREDFLK